MNRQDAETLVTEIRNLEIVAGACEAPTESSDRQAPSTSSGSRVVRPSRDLTPSGCLHEVRLLPANDPEGYAVALIFHQRHRHGWGPLVGHVQSDLASLLTEEPITPRQMAVDLKHFVIEEPHGTPEVAPDDEGIRWFQE